jgi:histone deacetylase complex subunit SAP18
MSLVSRLRLYERELSLSTLLTVDELRGYYVTKDLGLVFARDLARAPSEIRGTPSRTLDDIRFVVGDFLDIAFLAPDGPPRGPPGLGGGVGGGRDGPRTMSIRGSGAFADRGGRGGGFGGNGPRRGSRSPSPRRNMNGADGDWKR